jgi:hypothetical protein
MLPDGDIPDDRENVFEINAGELMGYEVTIFGDICGDRLEVSFGVGACGDSEGVKIHYCPMCGRELTEA